MAIKDFNRNKTLRDKYWSPNHTETPRPNHTLRDKIMYNKLIITDNI